MNQDFTVPSSLLLAVDAPPHSFIFSSFFAGNYRRWVASQQDLWCQPGFLVIVMKVMRLYASHPTFFFSGYYWSHGCSQKVSIPPSWRSQYPNAHALSTRMGEYGRPKVRRRLLRMHRLGIVSLVHPTTPGSSGGANALIFTLALSPQLTQMTWTRYSRSTGTAVILVRATRVAFR